MHSDTLGSDHFPTVTKIGIKTHYVSQDTLPRWKLQKADWEKFRLITDSMDIYYDDMTMDESNALFTFEVLAGCNVSIPKTNPNHTTKKTLPWWNACTEAVKQKNKAYYKYKKFKTDFYLKQFREAREKSKFILNSARKENWENYISKLTYKTNSKEVWNMIDKFKGKPFRPVETLKLYDARYHTNQEKAEVLTQYYQCVSSDESLDPEFRQHKNTQEPLIDEMIKNKSNSAEHRTFNAPFTLHELKTALDKKRSTAPGADTIHYEMLKNLTENGTAHLLKLINKSWKEHTLPSQWKESTIIPLLKPDKDPQTPQSYRPISLTSAICKVMEAMIAPRLITFIEERQLLGKTQSGFRKNRSTIDQILRLTSAIKTARLRKRSCCAAFLDLEKAFDLMWRKGVLQKLVQFGIEGNMLLWIQDFLTGRKIQVKLGTVLSDLRDCLNGSPQGAVLSPILFNLIINTLYEALESLPIDLSQFADD